MDNFINHLQSIYKLGLAAQTALRAHLKPKTLAKGDFLLKEGTVCHHLYFLETGCLRGFYNLDGKEITHWFGFENDFVTSFYSFITQKPSVENLQVLENSELWSISYESLMKLYDEFPEIERLGRMANEKYYIRLEERYVNFQFKTAAERYELLLEKMPHILQRVALGYVASYLGISQETLSRIRAKS